MKKGRGINQDELNLWNKVAQQAEPLKKQRSDVAMPAPASKEDPKAPDTFLNALPQRLNPNSGPKPNDLAPSLHDTLRKAPVQMDRKAYGQMNRGKLDPEARLDLHGMTLDRAHPALVQFILSHHASGKRLVLVITGKGKHRDDGGPIPVRFGVLRHQVPQWLALPPLSGVVLQVSPAHKKHGGGGAYYVYLRRRR